MKDGIVIIPGCNEKPQKMNFAMSLDKGTYIFVLSKLFDVISICGLLVSFPLI